ncbi:MAG: caspase family protein [Myxococcota bacterium]
MIFVGAALAAIITTPAPAGLSAVRASRRVAVVVGVDTYDDPTLNDLRFAAKDATDVADLLRDPNLGDFDEVQLLDGRVDRATLESVLDDVGRRLHRDDLFVLYFAGHGTIDLSTGESDLYLLPSDALLSAPRSTALAEDALAARLAALPARRRALIVDACHAGQGRSGLSTDTRALIQRSRGAVPTPGLLELGRSDAQLFAARPLDPALESEALQNGVYTHFLLEGLRGEGDADGDGLVDVSEAHEWARDRTLTYTSGLQVPWIRVEEEGRVPIYLTGTDAQRTRARRAILTGLASLPAGATVLVDGVARGGGGLERGWHDVEVLVDEETVLARRVHAAPGSRVSLERLIDRREADLSLAVGAAWAPVVLGDPLSPAVSPVLRGEYRPPDPRGGRPGVGVQILPTWGPVSDLGSLPTVTPTAFASWTWGDALSAGPELGTGALARFTPDGVQLGPVVTAGAIVRYERTHWVGLFTVGAEAPVLAVDSARTLTPRAALLVGWRP